MSFDIILKSTLALERLLHFLPEQDLLSLASTCQACTQAVLLYVLPSLSDVCHGLERRGVACKASLRLAFEVIRLCSVASQRQLPAASETRDCAANPSCSCNVQDTLAQDDEGWSAVSCQDIAEGWFVAQYAGEIISSREAEIRLQAYDDDLQAVGHALLIVRETLPSGKACLRMNIDATKKGNVARFFNHSCDGGNLRLEVVRCRGQVLPHVALFASKHIKEGEELTFSYGPPCSAASPSTDMQHLPASAQLVYTRRPCLCGTTACLGYLPRS